MKKKGGGANAAKAKRIVKEQAKRVCEMLFVVNVVFVYMFFYVCCSQEFVAEVREEKTKIFKEHRQKSDDFIPLESGGLSKVLSRFKPTKRK